LCILWHEVLISKKNMKKISLKNVARILVIAFLIFLFDFLTKGYALRAWQTPLVIIPDFFKLTLQYNTGVAFSIGVPYILQIVITPILLIVGFYFVTQNFDISKWPVYTLTGAIIGGAIGNFFDRIAYGHVIDFISVGRFPVFNIADIAITVSIFIFALFYGKIIRMN
jgi:signal peptidase II